MKKKKKPNTILLLWGELDRNRRVPGLFYKARGETQEVSEQDKKTCPFWED